MKSFEFKSDMIKSIKHGYNQQWHYDYIEYFFNDNYTQAYSIIMPQGTIGIKAMLTSNNRGIEVEYNVVSLDGEVLFDMLRETEAMLKFKIRKLENENSSLTERLIQAEGKLKAISGILA